MQIRTAALGVCFLLAGCATGGGGWTYHKDVDAINDFTRVYGQMKNRAATLGGGEAELAVDAVCGPNGLVVSFRSSETTVEIIYRIDKNPPVKIESHGETWSDKAIRDTLGISLYGVDAQAFVTEAYNGNILLVRRQNLSALTQSDHTFNLDSGKDELAKALEPCMKL